MKNVLVIAEAGVNHNGSLDLAKRLVELAADAGADIVKFQTFVADQLVSATAPKASYQLGGDETSSQLKMLKGLQLSSNDHHQIMLHCNQYQIKFLSTAFDLPSIEFLSKLQLGMWKIPSGEITNLPYLERIGSFNEQTILSTGMSTMTEVHDAIRVLTNAGLDNERLTLLHCNTEYPTPVTDVNLRAMLTLGRDTLLPFGYSDHTLGIEVPIAAVALGASVIEKHFTLDRSLSGPDHRASLEPQELKSMVHAIRNVEMAMGSSIKQPSISEEKNIQVARKSIHLAKSLSAGSTIEKDNLTMKRPGTGISPMQLSRVLGRKVRYDLPVEYMLRFEDLV